MASRTRVVGWWQAWAALVLSACAALGQTGPRLSDAVLSRPGMGLTVGIPEGATRSSYEIAGTGADRITFPGVAAFVNLTEVNLAGPNTLKGVADEIIRVRLESVSVVEVDPDHPGSTKPGLQTAKGRLLSRESREVHGWPAEVFYLQLANLGGEDTVYGYALFMPTGSTLARFELQSTAGDLPRAQPIFETMIGSTRITDPEAAAAERAVGVQAGVSFFQSVSPADIEAVIGRLGDAWRAERFYQPAASGSDGDAVELGYRLTRFTLGTRGDLRSEADRGRSRPEDRQKGYLVFQKARILAEDKMYDVEAGYFVTPDRVQEMWTIRQAAKSLRRPEAPASGLVVETGVRERDQLTITRSVTDGRLESVQPSIEGAGYISRAEVLLLPYLLMQRDAPGEYRFYAFNQSANRVTLREDAMEAPTAERPTWRYSSRAGEIGPVQVSTYDSKMELLRAEQSGEQVWEPMSVKRLAELWKSKGLPVN